MRAQAKGGRLRAIWCALGQARSLRDDCQTLPSHNSTCNTRKTSRKVSLSPCLMSQIGLDVPLGRRRRLCLHLVVMSHSEGKTSQVVSACGGRRDNVVSRDMRNTMRCDILPLKTADATLSARQSDARANGRLRYAQLD